MKPKKIERNDRYCYLSKNEVGGEKHFLITCPLYTPLRTTLENICKKNCTRFNSLNTEQKFIFIMSNENKQVLKILGKFIFDSLNLRGKVIEYFFT